MTRTSIALLLLLWAGARAWADPWSDCFLQFKDRDLRLRGCTQYIEENPASRTLVAAYFSRSSVHLYRREEASAIADFTKIIELDASNAAAYGMRGLTYFRQREYRYAIPDYTKAIALLDPKLHSQLLASHYMMRGLAHEKTGERELAVADLRRGLGINPNLRGAMHGLNRLGVSP